MKKIALVLSVLFLVGCAHGPTPQAEARAEATMEEYGFCMARAADAYCPSQATPAEAAIAAQAACSRPFGQFQQAAREVFLFPGISHDSLRYAAFTYDKVVHRTTRQFQETVVQMIVECRMPAPSKSAGTVLELNPRLGRIAR